MSAEIPSMLRIRPQVATEVAPSTRERAVLVATETFAERGVAAEELVELVEMFQVMAELEGLCARLSARRMTLAERTLAPTPHENLARIAEEVGELQQDKNQKQAADGEDDGRCFHLA